MTRGNADYDAALKDAKEGRTLTDEQQANLFQAASQTGERGDNANKALKDLGLPTPRTS